MNVTERMTAYTADADDRNIRRTPGTVLNSRPEKKQNTALLLVAGILGVCCGGFIIASPHVGGQLAAAGALTTAAASMILTRFAKR
jgi:hypothetical protein